jgi:biopolymer transport protein ExbB
MSDLFTRGTMLCLLAILVTSWYLLAMRVWDQARLLRAARAMADGFWSCSNLYDAVQGLNGRSPFRTVVEEGLWAKEQPGERLAEQIGVRDRISYRMQRAVDGWDKRLQSGLDLVASLAAIAPWVGLFGAACSIHRALAATAGSGPATSEALTQALSQGVIMTGTGIAVAVPVMLAHRFVVGRHVPAIDTLRDFTRDVQAVLLNGAILQPSDHQGDPAGVHAASDPGRIGSGVR